MSKELEEIIKKLSSALGEKKECRDGDCRLDRRNVKKIYSPEVGINKELLEKLKERQLVAKGQNPNICDCIVVCSDGRVFIVEILCGKLTPKELTSKKKQVKGCFFIVEEQLKIKVERAYIVYERCDMRGPQKTVFLRELRSLSSRDRILIKSLNDLRSGKTTFAIC